jgi:APA family basic amino acid/polyamine antiporter
MAQGTAPKLFVREATGLVKDIRPLDVFVYNTNNQNIGIGVAFILLLVPALYPGASMIWGTLFSALIALPMAAVYAYFSSVMPRSGGDYIYISRTIHPAVGFISGWNWVAWMTLYVGIPAAFFGQYGLTGFFRMLGASLDSEGLVELGNGFSTDWGVFLAGTALIVFFGVVFWRGTRVYFRIQNVAFSIATLGLVVAALILLFSSPDRMTDAFNEYAASIGGPANAAQNVIETARSQGFEANVPFSGHQTLIAMVWPLYIVLYAITSSFLGGEVRQAKRSQVLGMPVSVLYVTAWMVVLIALVTRVVGNELVGAIGFLLPEDLETAAGMSFNPTYNELVGMLVVDNTLVVAFLGLSFVFWTYVWLPINFLAATRGILAWSFDRVAPEKVAYVNPKTHTPTWAIVIVGLIGEFALIAWVLDWVTNIAGIFAWIISFILTCIAAIVFPFRRKDLYETSPFRGKVAGVPWISIVGAMGVVGLLIAEYAFWRDPVVGVVAWPWMWWVIPLIFISGLVWYYAAKRIQGSRGIRVEQTFAEIPPE